MGVPITMQCSESTGGCRPSGRREQGEIRCSNCPQRPVCVPSQLQGAALATFENEVIHLPALSAGGVLVAAGEPIESVYALKQGVLKCLYHKTDGSTEIATLHFPGAVLGQWDPVGRVWSCSYVAVQDAWVCRIPLSIVSPNLQRRLARLLSAELREFYEFRLTLARCGPAQRLAALLLRFADALQELRFSLPVSHTDIASHLGLSETALDRCYRDLAACGWLSQPAGEVVIRDRDALRRFVEG